MDKARNAVLERHPACMTNLSRLPSRAEHALRIYADAPMSDGDVLLLLDDTVCLEFEQLTACWDAVSRRHLAEVVGSTASRALLAVAREGGELLPADYQLWRDLHEDLRATSVELLPVRALPAA